MSNSAEKMGMKLTKRKAFKFYRSYYDVYNELDDENKLIFIEALLDKQFLNIDPFVGGSKGGGKGGANAMARFAYMSQLNTIESQVKGFEDKTGISLTSEGGSQGGSQGGVQGGTEAPSLQEKEKEKEKEKDDFSVTSSFNLFWTEYKKMVARATAEKSWARLSKKEREACLAAVPAYVKSTPEKRWRLNPTTYLNQKRWEDDIEQTDSVTKPYSSQATKQGFY
jgi:hypothetical protein